MRGLLADVPATVMSEERPGSRIKRAVLGARRATRAAVHDRTAAAEYLRCRRVHARLRRGPAAVEDVIVGVVERESARLLDRGLREYGCCERQRQKGCRAKYPEFGHDLSPP